MSFSTACGGKENLWVYNTAAKEEAWDAAEHVSPGSGLLLSGPCKTSLPLASFTPSYQAVVKSPLLCGELSKFLYLCLSGSFYEQKGVSFVSPAWGLTSSCIPHHFSSCFPSCSKMYCPIFTVMTLPVTMTRYHSSTPLLFVLTMVTISFWIPTQLPCLATHRLLVQRSTGCWPQQKGADDRNTNPGKLSSTWKPCSLPLLR